METESESLDIAGLRWTVLQPLQSDSEESQLTRQRQLDAIRAEYAKFPQLQSATRVTTVATLSNTVPELASTVPDSQQQFPLDVEADLESQFNSLPPVVALKPISITHRMNTQGSDAATQELSPSHIESMLNNRSRSALQQQNLLQNEDMAEEDEEEPTQFTLHEGDEGHIDIVSSLMSPPQLPKHVDSDPVDFSPSQSQRALSQFPESQRFKTPATIGRKRRYNGDTVDSPALPRKPLLRGGVNDDEVVMGLSQAFAATQANTSPFVGGVHEELPSDRPSPNIQLQPLPITTTSSSPMRRMISPFQRASTEPAARYISSKESQDERKRQALLRQQEMMTREDDSDDGFDDEPNSLVKDQRRRRVDQRKLASFKRLASPPKVSGRGVSLSKSSPIRSPSRASPRGSRNAQRTAVRNGSSPTSRSLVGAGNDSEEETEQEDDADIAVTRSSQGPGMFQDENKENCLESGSQIPETTARLFRVVDEPPNRLEDSPSLRRGRAVNGVDGAALPYSSGPFAVADSQPTQPQRQYQGPTPIANRVDVDEGIDHVPQSPTTSLQPNNIASIPRVTEGSELDFNGTRNAAPEHTNSESSSRHQPPGTIPETSSNGHGQSDKTGKSSDRQPSSDSRGQYETAETRLPPASATSNQGNVVDLSSPPIATTPPGRRRKRMAEIAAEPSPLKSQVSFSVSQALNLDVNFESPLREALNLDVDFQSPLREAPSIVRTIVGEREPAHSRSGAAGDGWDVEEPESSAPDEPTTRGYDGGVSGSNTPAFQDTAGRSHAQSGLLSSLEPPRNKGPSAKPKANLQSSNGASRHTSRREKWDLDASPPQKSVPVIRPTSLKRKAADLEGPQDQDQARRTLTKRLKSVRNKSPCKAAAGISGPDCEQDERHETPEPPVMADHQSNDTTKADASLVADAVTAPNMVFACFNGKTRAYYPALCLGPSNADSSRFLIQWEGYDPDEIDQHGVRSLELRVGDQVKVNMEGFPKVSYVIRGFKDRIVDDHSGQSHPKAITDRLGHKTLLVAPKQRKSLPRNMSLDSVKTVPVSAIYLDSNMWGQMRDRVYKYKAMDEPISSSGVSTPLERPSTPSTPASRNRRNVTVVIPPAPSVTLPAIPSSDGMFANMAFAISYEDRLRKARLVEQIESHGGTVLKESFLDLLEPDTTEVKLKAQFAELSFTALLTERHSRKEKYIQALALGLPCLSGKWVEACISSDSLVDWTTYLLPAGESAELDGATKSRLLPAAAAAAAGAGLNVQHKSVMVKDMIASRPQILGNSRVIVVTGKGKAEARRKPYLFLIRALGAGPIEMEPDLSSARARFERSELNTTVNGEAHAADGGEWERDGDGHGHGHGGIKWIFVDDRDISTARTMFSASVSASRSFSMSISGSPSTINPDTGGKGQINAKEKAKSRRTSRVKKRDVEHPVLHKEDTNGQQGARNAANAAQVKVMCNEDIVQSLILGKLWMGT